VRWCSQFQSVLTATPKAVAHSLRVFFIGSRNQWIRSPIRCEAWSRKKATLGVSLPLGLPREGSVKGIKAQVGNDVRPMRPGGLEFVQFPLTESDGANVQPASGFGLVDAELEATFAKMTAEGGRVFGNRIPRLRLGKCSSRGTEKWRSQ